MFKVLSSNAGPPRTNDSLTTRARAGDELRQHRAEILTTRSPWSLSQRAKNCRLKRKSCTYFVFLCFFFATLPMKSRTRWSISAVVGRVQPSRHASSSHPTTHHCAIKLSPRNRLWWISTIEARETWEREFPHCSLFSLRFGKAHGAEEWPAQVGSRVSSFMWRNAPR